jgi:integrase
MKGCRPLTKDEVQRILSLNVTFRDKVLFILGINTGYRISELLSLKVSNVIAPTGQILSQVSVRASNMKGKSGRAIKLNSKTKDILRKFCKGRDLNAPLFQSRVKGKYKALKAVSRSRAHIIIQEMFQRAKVFGSVATHTMRKTFAQNMRRLLNGDIVNLMKAMGHRSINTTIAYMSFDNDEIDSAIEQLSFF